MRHGVAVVLLIFAVAVSMVSCGGDAEKHTDEHAEKAPATESAHKEGEGEHKEGEEEHGEEESETVRVEAEALESMQLVTGAAQQRSAQATVSVLGTLGVNETAYAQVPSPIAAQVLKLYAAPGARVGKGTALAELQSPELGRARAEYISASARVDLARRALERKRGLLADRVVAAREVQEAEADFASAQADLQASAAVLRSFGVSGGDNQSPVFMLRAPIAGVVVERSAAVGQMADASQPLYRIAELSRLWLTVNTFERDALKIREGTSAQVQFAAIPDRTFSGKITYVGRQVDPQSRTIPVRIEIDNRDGVLRPGLSATALLPTGDESSGAPVVTVPVDAVQRVENAWHVFIPKEKGVFEKRRVERGRTFGTDVEILSGLQPGEQVVTKGAFLLKAEHDKAGAGHHDH